VFYLVAQHKWRTSQRLSHCTDTSNLHQPTKSEIFISVLAGNADSHVAHMMRAVGACSLLFSTALTNTESDLAVLAFTGFCVGLLYLLVMVDPKFMMWSTGTSGGQAGVVNSSAGWTLRETSMNCRDPDDHRVTNPLKTHSARVAPMELMRTWAEPCRDPSELRKAKSCGEVYARVPTNANTV